MTRTRTPLGRWWLYAVLTVALVAVVSPFVWMILGSFKSEGELRQSPPTWWPHTASLDNYAHLFSRLDFGTYFTNSVVVAVAVTAGNLLFCSMLGYALAMLDFRGKKFVFLAVMTTLMIPGVVTFVPLFVLVANAGLIDTPAGPDPAVPRQPVRRLPHAAVHHRPAARPDRRRPGGRRRRAAHLRPDHPAAVRPGAGDAGDPHVPRQLEQLPLAAGRRPDRVRTTPCRSPWRSTPRARTARSTACSSPGPPWSCCRSSRSSWSSSAASSRASPPPASSEPDRFPPAAPASPRRSRTPSERSSTHGQQHRHPLPPPAHRGRRRPPPRPSASRPAARRQRSAAPRRRPPLPACVRGGAPHAAAARPACTAGPRDTWHSLVAMTDPKTGLPPTTSRSPSPPATAPGYTSPTNIGGYLWCAVVARDLGIITRGECTQAPRPDPAHAAADGAPRAERHVLQLVRRGDAARLITTWPEDGSRVYPFLLQRRQRLARRRPAWSCMSADKGAAPLAGRLFDRMRWDMFYDADTAHPGVRPGGLIHGGFYDAPPPPGSSTYTGNHIGVGPDVWYTNHHYDTTVSETRITSYLGILTGQIPAKQYFAHVAHLPGDLRLGLAGDAAGRREPHLPGGRRLRGRLHLPRHAHRPRLGRQHVRGAHARRVRARVELGAAQLGPQPPAARPRPARARPRSRRTTATGASRRRATRSAATASTASTRSA